MMMSDVEVSFQHLPLSTLPCGPACCFGESQVELPSHFFFKKPRGSHCLCMHRKNLGFRPLMISWQQWRDARLVVPWIPRWICYKHLNRCWILYSKTRNITIVRHFHPTKLVPLRQGQSATRLYDTWASNTESGKHRSGEQLWIWYRILHGILC